jgi:lipopolysaccharide heptosyltransferase II
MEAKKILAVRLDGIGDMVMTGPALVTLRQGRPDRHVTVLASPAGSAVARLMRGVDRVLPFTAPWMKSTAPQTGAALERQLVQHLQHEAFHAAVIFTVYSQNPLPAALLCYLADIPLRAAYCRENPYQLLTDWLPEPDTASDARHEVQRQLALVHHLGCQPRPVAPLLEIPADALRSIHRRLRAVGLDRDRPWLVLHPGATAPSRRYPAERFADAGAALAAIHGFQLVVTGDRGECDLAASVTSGIGTEALNLAGQLSLPEFAALIKIAPLVVANNTSAVHLASAAGTPVVDLYALTNMQHMPWGVPHRVLYHDVPCRNCLKSICPQGHHACLTEVPASAVVDAVLELYPSRVGQAAKP